MWLVWTVMDWKSWSRSNCRGIQSLAARFAISRRLAMKKGNLTRFFGARIFVSRLIRNYAFTWRSNELMSVSPFTLFLL